MLEVEVKWRKLCGGNTEVGCFELATWRRDALTRNVGDSNGLEMQYSRALQLSCGGIKAGGEVVIDGIAVTPGPPDYLDVECGACNGGAEWNRDVVKGVGGRQGKGSVKGRKGSTVTRLKNA